MRLLYHQKRQSLRLRNPRWVIEAVGRWIGMVFGSKMAVSPKYPREWLERVPAVVFACLLPGELRIIVHPGVGLADGGAPRDVPADLIPPELRMPNTPLWLKLDEKLNILHVSLRET